MKANWAPAFVSLYRNMVALPQTLVTAYSLWWTRTWNMKQNKLFLKLLCSEYFNHSKKKSDCYNPLSNAFLFSRSKILQASDHHLKRQFQSGIKKDLRFASQVLSISEHKECKNLDSNSLPSLILQHTSRPGWWLWNRWVERMSGPHRWHGARILFHKSQMANAKCPKPIPPLTPSF